MSGLLSPEYRLPTVAPSGQPLQAPQVSSTPAAFGGAQGAALEQGGREIRAGANELFAAALRQQGIQNEADAKAADASLATDIRTLLFDPEKGYYAKRGKEAVDGAPAVLQSLDDLKKKYSETLKSDEARRLYGDVATRRINSLQTQIGDKVITERRTYYDQASAARTQNFVDDAGVNYADQKRVEQAIAGARSEILSQAEVNHEPPEETQRKIRLAESTAITNVVKRWAEDDPYTAKKIRDANAGRINSGDGLVLDKLLKEQTLRRGSQDQASAIRDGESGDGKIDNNIGNIVRSGFKYSGGKGAPQGAFETFTTPAHGVAAAYQTIDAKAKQNGGSITFTELIGGNGKVKGWAPADDGKDPMLKGNDPNSYAARLAKSVGLKPTDSVPLEDDGKMATVLAEMNRHEKGKQTVPDGAFAKGITLAKGGGRTPGEAAPELDPKTGRPSLQWQLDQASKIPDPDMRDATMQRLRVLHGQDEAVVAEARKKAGDEVQALVMAGRLTDPGQVPVDKWLALDPAQQRSLQAQMDANARGKDNPPNPTLYAELMHQAVEDPEAFKKRDLVPLASQLPQAHWTKFQDLQASMGRKENAEAEKQVSMARALRVSDALLRSAGIYLGYADSKGKITKADDFDKFKAQFASSLDQEIDRFRAENGKRPDDGDLLKIADRLLLQGRFRGTGIFSDDRTVSFLQGKGEGAPQFYVRYGDIPADRRKTVEDQLKAKGLPSDKTAVENAYTAWRMQGNR